MPKAASVECQVSIAQHSHGGYYEKSVSSKNGIKLPEVQCTKRYSVSRKSKENVMRNLLENIKREKEYTNY